MPKITSRKNFWGNIEHFDENGNKLGESRRNFWGNMEHYDTSGNKTGESRRNFWDNEDHYDASGNKVGTSRNNFWDGKDHYNLNGEKVGSTRKNFLNNRETIRTTDEHVTYSGGGSAFETIYYGLTKIVIGFCLIISPILSILSLNGTIEWENSYDPIAFYIFTVIDIALLFWWASRERKRMIALVSICVAIAIALSITPITKAAERNRIYRHALELIEQKRYLYAADVLEPYAEYKNRKLYALWKLCKAHTSYYYGEVAAAGSYASSYDLNMPVMLKLESEEPFIQRVIKEADVLREKERNARW